MGSVNASLLKHKLIIGVDDRGKLSCHKVSLIKQIGMISWKKKINETFSYLKNKLNKTFL